MVIELMLAKQLRTIPRQAAPTVPQIVLLTVHQPAVLQVPALLLYPMQHSLLETHMYGVEQALPVVLTALALCRVYMQTLA